MIKKIVETKFAIYRFDELETSYQQLINKAKEQVNKAYAPYSGFHVGAAIELENGQYLPEAIKKILLIRQDFAPSV